jgi:ribonuclease P protein component
MAKARRSADNLFTVLARTSDRARPRLGLAISRKAARRSVDRNRIKRISREAFRLCGHDSGVDVIVFARNAAANESRAALRSSLDKHFRRLLSEQTA